MPALVPATAAGAQTAETYLVPVVESPASEILISGPWAKVTYTCALSEGQVCNGTTSMRNSPGRAIADAHRKYYRVSYSRPVNLLGGETRSVAIRLTRSTLAHLKKGFDRWAILSFSVETPGDGLYQVVRLVPDFPSGA
jgi:hypothetical protein